MVTSGSNGSTRFSWLLVGSRFRRRLVSDLASIEEIKKNWDARTGDARQELVLIGMQMDEQALIERLDCCLLSDEEMALGPQAWQSWSNPFKQDDETMLIA